MYANTAGFALSTRHDRAVAGVQLTTDSALKEYSSVADGALAGVRYLALHAAPERFASWSM